MKSFNDTEQANLVIEKRIPARRRMVTALPKSQHQVAMAAHATMMSMLAAGFYYDVSMRAWVKRSGQSQ